MVEIRPIKTQPKTWDLPDEYLNGGIVLEPPIVNSRYVVAIPEGRLKELEQTTGFNLSLNYTGAAHEFWGTAQGRVKLPLHPMVFDETNPLHEIQIGIAKAHPAVAPSLAAYNAGQYPQAIFVIVQDQEDVKIRAAKYELQDQAIVALRELTPERKRQIIAIAYGKTARNMSDDDKTVILRQLIDDNPKKLLQLINISEEELKIRSIIIEGVYARVIEKKGSTHYYNGELLGTQTGMEDDAINFLNDPNNKPVYDQILDALNKV